MRVANILGAGGFALRIILSACLGLFYFHATLRAQNVVLTWNPSTDPNVAGYKIYSGTASQNYTNVVVVGNATNATISGLAYGTTYYFAATTYDDSGNESPYSNEATFSVPTPAVGSSTTTLSLPTLNAIADVNINENASAQAINLSGITVSGSAANIITPQIVSGGGSPALQITATSSDTGIVPNPSVNYTSPKSTGTLTFQPVANISGTATITVTVNNGQPSNNIVAQSFTITVLPTGSGLPEITTQPTNIVVVAGEAVSFNLAATGQVPLEYQWLFNGAQIPNETGATLTLTNVTTAQAGNYYATISNDLGLTNSVIVVLSVFSTSEAMLSAITQANTAAAVRAAQNSVQSGLSSSNAPAYLTSPIKTGNQFSFVVTGINQTNYVVQASSDLINWISLQTNASPFTFVDANLSGSSQRFYRVYKAP
jgi:fibronectin type 3 domain-containing protein